LPTNWLILGFKVTEKANINFSIWRRYQEEDKGLHDSNLKLPLKQIIARFLNKVLSESLSISLSSGLKIEENKPLLQRMRTEE